MSADHRDLVIEGLLVGEAEAREDAVRYRLLALAAIECLAELTRECDRLRATLHRVRDEYRAYRAATVCAPRSVA